MELDETLQLLRRHGVGAASFDAAGNLTSVTFGTVTPPSDDAGDGERTHGVAEEPGWRSSLHRAAGVLQGRERSLREDRADG